MDQQHTPSNQPESEMRSPTSPLRPAIPAALPTVTVKMLTTLLGLSPDALILVDQDGEIVLGNEQAASLFGYHPDELIGHPLEMLLPERFHTVHVSHRANYAAAPRLRPMGEGLTLLDGAKMAASFP